MDNRQKIPKGSFSILKVQKTIEEQQKQTKKKQTHEKQNKKGQETNVHQCTKNELKRKKRQQYAPNLQDKIP